MDAGGLTVGGVIPMLIARVFRRGERRPWALALQRAQAHAPPLERRERNVRLVEPAPRLPLTPFERLVVETLTREGVLRFNTLVERIALDFYLDELRHGAWILDIGLFGSKLFIPEVARELKAGDGILWEIKAEERAR